jgi:hypothetical protein
MAKSTHTQIFTLVVFTLGVFTPAFVLADETTEGSPVVAAGGDTADHHEKVGDGHAEAAADAIKKAEDHKHQAETKGKTVGELETEIGGLEKEKAALLAKGDEDSVHHAHLIDQQIGTLQQRVADLKAEIADHEDKAAQYIQQAQVSTASATQSYANAAFIRSGGTTTTINNVTKGSATASEASPTRAAMAVAPAAAAAAAPAAAASAAPGATPSTQSNPTPEPAQGASSVQSTTQSDGTNAQILKLLETSIAQNDSPAPSSTSTSASSSVSNEAKSGSSDKETSASSQPQQSTVVYAHGGSPTDTSASAKTAAASPAAASTATTPNGSVNGSSAGTSLYAALPASKDGTSDDKSKTLSQMLAEARAARGAASEAGGRGIAGSGGDTGVLIQSSANAIPTDVDGELDLAGMMAAAGLSPDGAEGLSASDGTLSSGSRVGPTRNRGFSRLIDPNAPVIPAALAAAMKSNKNAVGSVRPSSAIAKN